MILKQSLYCVCCGTLIASCRFIPVGNEFNGLFTEAKEKPSELLDVPLEIFGKPKVLDPSRGPTATLLIETLGLRRRRMLRTQEEKGRAWLQGSYLAVCTWFSPLYRHGIVATTAFAGAPGSVVQHTCQMY